MISQEHRFKSRSSLAYVYRHGSTSRGPLFAVKSVVNPRRSSYRLAVVISRKVHKSAAVRNRIRRRLYEIVRSLEGDISQPYDIVLTVFEGQVADEPATSLTAQVKKQLQAAGIIPQSLDRRAKS